MARFTVSIYIFIGFVNALIRLVFFIETVGCYGWTDLFYLCPEAVRFLCMP